MKNFKRPKGRGIKPSSAAGGLKLSARCAESILPNKKNKGESSMKSFFFVLAHLTLVTFVYAFAHRAGYWDA